MAGAGNLANSLAVQREKVGDVLPLLYERDDVFLKMLQVRGDVEKVSARNMRLPLQIRSGGKGRTVNLDGGDLGTGGFTQYDFAQVTPQAFLWAFQWNKIIEFATNSSEKATEKLVPREVKQAMAAFRSWLDKIFQTSGNGGGGTISSISGQVLTMTNPPGAKGVVANADYQVYDTTLTINRGKITAAIVDVLNKQ